MSKFTRRDFLEDSLLAAAAAAAIPLLPGAARAGQETPAKRDAIRVGVVGVRGRGRAHVNAYRQSPDAEVVGICDPDSAVVDGAMKAAPGAKYYKDIREMLEDADLDAVSIAAPNHWHSLASIWALQAGKHVYVEKPISHNVFEGRQVVEAAKAYGKVVQHGTQARTEPATRDAIQWMLEGGLGEVHLAHALCYKPRGSIGKVTGPQQPPETCDYDLWTGPAELKPLMRKNLHYDWHWDFNTGSGDMGNQGVHQMDIARWGLGLDSLPTKVRSLGCRLGYVDDANTPNTQVSTFDYGDKQLIFEVRGLKTPQYMGAGIGVVFHGEGGYLVSASYGKLNAYDHDGKVMKTFTGSSNHFQNFLDAVKAEDPSKVNADAREGHLSAALCHLGNISYRLGTPTKLASTDTPFEANEAANESFRRYREHLVANGIDASAADFGLGPTLSFDPGSERFTGKLAAQANELATRPARGAFTVPAQV